MNIIELRSDTMTKPSPAMRQAMANAEVGDDCFGEDPSVNRLEEAMATMLGKEAGLFVTSGTQGNQLAVRTQTHHGNEVIAEQYCHMFNAEAGALGLRDGERRGGPCAGRGPRPVRRRLRPERGPGNRRRPPQHAARALSAAR